MTRNNDRGTEPQAPQFAPSAAPRSPFNTRSPRFAPQGWYERYPNEIPPEPRKRGDE